MSIIENAITWMEDTAKDNSHGYDQIFRWGEKGDYDCSAAVIQSWEQAGVPVKTKGATYTGNIYQVFTKNGFDDITSSVNLVKGTGLKRGDVLLAEGHHVAMYCGNGMEVEASINEKGTAKGGKPGDQTGREFLIRAYRNYPWTKVLRYKESGSKNQNDKLTEVAKAVIAGKYGDGDKRKKKLKSLGFDPEEVQKKVNELLKGQTTSAQICYEVTAKNGVNLRSSAGVKRDNLISALPKGTVVTGTGKTETVEGAVWRQVKLSTGKTGWVSGKYLKKQ